MQSVLHKLKKAVELFLRLLIFFNYVSVCKIYFLAISKMNSEIHNMRDVVVDGKAQYFPLSL